MADHRTWVKTPLTACLLALTLLAPPLRAADASKDASLFVILYKQGPAWKEGVPMQQQDAIGAHNKYMKQLFEQQVVLDAGPTLDEPGGVVVLEAKDLDAAKAIMAADPSITRQMFVGEVHSWSATFHSPVALPGDKPSPGSVQRSATQGLVTSSADPKVQIGLPASSKFVGGDNWYMMAYQDSIQLDAYVDADAANALQHLYWVQFEAYNPAFPDYHHSYDSTCHATLGGMDFLVDTWAGYTDTQEEPDSDSLHLKALLIRQGYTIPKAMLTVRFVYLMDGARKELMLIYKEPLPPGFTVEDLKPGGKGYGQWPAIEKGLIERGQQSFQLN